jgi:hypothetical protein
MVLPSAITKRVIVAIIIALVISIVIEIDIPLVSSVLSLPVRLMGWPLTLAYWRGVGFNLLLYGFIAYWCQKQISLSTDSIARPSRATSRVLWVGLCAVGVATIAAGLIIAYDSQPGIKQLDPAAPNWVVDAFPFFIIGVAGILVLLAAVIVVLGRKIKVFVAGL